MKTLYLDCGMGAAGDMLTAALLELFPDPDQTLEELNSLGIPDVRFVRESSVRSGITGTHIRVLIDGVSEEFAGCPIDSEAHHHHDGHHHHHHHDHHHHDAAHHPETENTLSADADIVLTEPPQPERAMTHVHRGMAEIEDLVNHLNVPDEIRPDILSVYRLIAEAESAVHGVPVSEIHFHEVGAMDAVADITAVCWLMNRLAPAQVIVSPVHVGSGEVRCAHGILPVPAPAAAFLLKEIPIYGGSVRGELCTPTGAALLRYYASSFGDMPVMRVSSIGIGCGTKDFEKANILRAMLGETEESPGEIVELVCAIDDMVPEQFAFAAEEIFLAGAVDVYAVPALMKKGRPGQELTVLCPAEKKDDVLTAVFRHTPTIGIRERCCRRHLLDRKEEIIPTVYGPVRKKISSGFGVRREKYEYDDLSRIAREQDLTIGEVIRQIDDNNDF